MKKVLLLSLLVAFTISLNAQTSEKKWGVGVGIGGYMVTNNQGTGFMPEMYLSRYLDSKFDIMVKFQDGFHTISSSSGSRVIGNDNANILLNLHYKLTDESKKFRPYLFAGPGYLMDNSAKGINFDLGIGSKHYFTPSAALYFEAAYMNGIKGERTKNKGTILEKTIDVHDNLFKATIGLEYDFLKAKDTDMDGVSDVKDKCPDTPAGVNVDDKGCPVDTDGDGVADYLDDCPTIAGLTSLKGCPDKDKDGIADKNDACPDVAGIASLKGCPDADGDGIADKDDKCPNTKSGSKVDASGCPIDTDKDGVIDSEDECPTVKGPVDNKGCPVKEVIKEIDKSKEVTADQVEVQKDIKVDAVHFVSGKYYLTDYSKAILDKLVQTLNSNPAYNVNAFGYTDSQGSDQSNIKLSQNRVASVFEYLVSKGISDKRIIQQKAFGKADPVATNDTPEGRLLNRRVEFEIFKLK